jgi:hypothetical protein
MARLAFMTFGILREPYGSPGSAGFEDRLARTFAAANLAPGMIAYDDTEVTDWTMPVDDPRWGPFGRYRLADVYPDDRSDLSKTREAVTLSVWRDIESVFAFAYSGLHLKALQRKAEWFEPRRWPTYVAWWIGDDEKPTWDDAATRLDRLHRDGPGPEAFDFHHPFDAEGQPMPRPAPAERS